MSKRKAILRPLALAFIVAVGFATVFAMLVGWLDSVWEQWRGRSYTYESAQVRQDGQPLIHRYGLDRGRQHDTYFTLDRVEVPASTENGSGATGAELLVAREPDFGEFPLDVSKRVREFGWQPTNGEWYFIHDGERAGRGYFIGFNTESKLRVGFIGRRGFCSERPAREDCFAFDGLGLRNWGGPCQLFPSGRSPAGNAWVDDEDFPRERIYLIAGDQLLRVDLRERTVATVIDSAKLISLGMVEPVRPAKAPRETAGAGTRHVFMAVRTADRVLLFNAAGTQKGAYTIPADLRGKSFSFYDLNNGTALLSVEGDEFVWIDAAGSVLKRKKATLEKNSLANDFPPQVAAFAPAPIEIGLVIAIGAAGRVEQGESSSYAAGLSWSFSHAWPALLAVSILGAALAWLCYRRQRRFAQPWTGVWVAFVFLSGLPGLVGYLFHRRWPVLDACPSCGRMVPRDRESCAACGAEFPPPPLKGIEVFA